MRITHAAGVVLLGLAAGCAQPAPQYDVVVRHGTLYDGSGAAPVVADVAIAGDKIAAVGDLSKARGREEVDATGLAVAPGFINMLSHSETSLLADGRSQGAIRQGVTLEVFGESSMGPLNEQMRKDQAARQGDIKYDVDWTTLGGYLDKVVAQGTSSNVASFVSAATVRINEIGYVNRPPTSDELERMRGHVKLAMDEGAMGLTSALIYTPGTFAKTDELIALAKVAS
ncbi:MAG: D-aminoacylase, partial [Acidobacteriia bacterium]|nr:D-aminoacylase [Terriglobia bacterium]